MMDLRTVGSACAVWVLGITSGCGDVTAKNVDAAIDSRVVVDAPAVDSPPPAPLASCKAILAAVSGAVNGMYTIDPDGSGLDAPFSVYCDMTTDGGGWTVIFFPTTANLSTAPASYTTSTQRLLADAAEVLIAYRSAAMAAYTNYARFGLPSDWRASTPFTFLEKDLTTNVSINGGAPASATVRYGYNNYAATCADAWSTSGGNLGRICVQGTAAPFYTSFASAVGDFCPNSGQSYSVVSCTNDLRFSIAVR